MAMSSGSSILTPLAIGGLVLAIIYQVAPGEPAWIDNVPSPPPAGDYEIQTFPGGDGSTILMGRLHHPVTKNTDAPVIVMAHGLGLSQDSSLDSFVDAFTQAGFATFTFDYATFGYSGGWPRHQVKPEAHVADLKAALKHVRSLTVEDTRPIGLWGTSMGAGHVLRVAAEDSEIHVVVANVPHVKSAFESLLGTLQRDPYNTIPALGKVTGAMLKWIMSHLIHGKTTYIPLHGLPGSAAMMQNPGDDQGYGALITKEARQAGWTNLASVGSVVPTLLYRPYDHVHKIQAPTLLIPASQDTLCPAASAQEAAKKIPNSKLIMLEDKAHFDVYQRPTLKKILSETVQFFKEHLGAAQQ